MESVKTAIEDFFIYPLISKQHLRKWKIQGYIYTLQMQDPKKRVGYDVSWVKVNFPKTYRYLKGFEKILKERAAYMKYLEKAPVYSMFNLGEYTFSPYKVVWNRIGNKLEACVISSMNDEILGEKLIIPEEHLIFIPTEKEVEAHFLCALMNSTILDFVLRSFAGGPLNFGSPKAFEDTVRIPKFDAKNETHSKLAEFSKKAHELAVKEDQEALRAVEEEVDKEVADLFGLTKEELEDVKEALQVVYGEGAS